MTVTEFALRTDGLGKRYRKGWALRDCTLALPAGGVIALVGPNGAGKTTLLRLVVGLLAPSSGTVEVLGQDVTASTPQTLSRVGFLAQDHPLYKRFTVAEMLRFGRACNVRFDQGLAERRLGKLGIPVYGVQALNRRHATSFYKELAQKSGGFHLSLDQFAYITDTLLAICYKQSGDMKLQAYEAEVAKEGRLTRGLNTVFNTMLKRATPTAYAATDLRAIPPGRFQFLDVDKDSPIKNFVTENGLKFKAGRGFYEYDAATGAKK